jgi:hypothetical protein
VPNIYCRNTIAPNLTSPIFENLQKIFFPRRKSRNRPILDKHFLFRADFGETFLSEARAGSLFEALTPGKKCFRLEKPISAFPPGK